MQEPEIHFSSAGRNLASAFPAIIELYFEKLSPRTKKRDFDILDKRFALIGASNYTLEDLGTYYDLTRERIRQIEARAIKELDQLLRGELRTKGWEIASVLRAEYMETVDQLRTSSLIVLEEQVDSLFLSKYDEQLSPGFRDVFMEVAGFARLPRSIDGFRGNIKSCWCATDQYKAKEIPPIFRALDIIFGDPAKPLSLFDLTIKAKKAAKAKVSNQSLEIAISACSDLELIDDEVRVKLQSLRSAADKSFRILDASNKPMHYSAITREINLLQKDSAQFRPLKEVNVKNQLVADSRFVPVGRSGEWGLSTWKDLSTDTIVDTISHILHKAGAPMKFADIVSAVKQMRPDASKNSVSVYLNQKDAFSRVGKAEYALAVWRLPQAQTDTRIRNVGADNIISVVKTAFGENDSVPFPKLIQAVRDHTKLSEASARQRLLAFPFLQMRSIEGQKHKSVYLVGSLEEAATSQAEKVLLRTRVQEEALAVLKEQPNEPLKKGDLYSEVCKTVKCQRPTFYRYLSEMQEVRQFKEGNQYFAVFEHEEDVTRIDIDLAGYTLDPTLEKELKRPLSKLTVDEVDIALFELGLLFENKLREFLNAARSEGTITISSKDMGRLTDMVNCVVREGVVTTGHHLNTLREERNKRAHGTIPTLQERQRLFNKAHYVADLFVKYIVLFHDKKNAT